MLVQYWFNIGINIMYNIFQYWKSFYSITRRLFNLLPRHCNLLGCPGLIALSDVCSQIVPLFPGIERPFHVELRFVIGPAQFQIDEWKRYI